MPKRALALVLALAPCPAQPPSTLFLAPGDAAPHLARTTPQGGVSLHLLQSSARGLVPGREAGLAQPANAFRHVQWITVAGLDDGQQLLITSVCNGADSSLILGVLRRHDDGYRLVATSGVDRVRFPLPAEHTTDDAASTTSGFFRSAELISWDPQTRTAHLAIELSGSFFFRKDDGGIVECDVRFVDGVTTSLGMYPERQALWVDHGRDLRTAPGHLAARLVNDPGKTRDLHAVRILTREGTAWRWLDHPPLVASNDYAIDTADDGAIRVATIRHEKDKAPVLVRATWHPGAKKPWQLLNEPIDAGSLASGTPVRFTIDAARGPIAWAISADGSVQRLGK